MSSPVSDRSFRRRAARVTTSSKLSLTQLEDRSVPAAAGTLDLLFGGTGSVLTDLQGGTDEAHGIAVDAVGRYVVAGFTSTAVETEDGGAPALPGGGAPDGVGGGGGGGEESAPNPLTDFAIVRYNSNGTIDTSFGTGGKVIVNVSNLIDGTNEEDKAFGVAIQGDGKMIVSGYVNRGTVTLPSGGTLIDHDFALVRLNTNGSLDTTFGNGGLVVTDFGLSFSDEAIDVAIQPDGKIIAAGRTGTSSSEGEGATADFALARYNSNGTLDTTFGTGGLVHADLASGSKDEGKRITLMPDGRIVMVGMSESESGPDFATARFNSDGSLDTSFGGTGHVMTDFGGTDEGQDVIVQPDGKPVAIGHVGEGAPADFGLVRYNIDGTLDNTFGNNGKVQTDFAGRADFPFAIGIQSDGKIVAAGRGIATTTGGGGAGSSGAFQYAIARYNPDGTLDTNFGGSGKVLTNLGGPSPDQGYALTVQSDRIVVAGVAASDFGLAAYLTNDIADPGSPGTGATPTGPQFTVAAVTGSESGPPVVAVVNSAGDFVSAWESLGEDGSGVGVYAQRYNANGVAIGTPILVNTTTTGNQSHPAIATDGNGHVIIAWEGESASGGAYDIYFRAGDFNIADPTAWLTPGETRVNVETTGSQTNPTAAMDAEGRFVIAWQSDQDKILNPDPLTTTGINIYARYGTLAGGLLGTVDTPIANSAGDQVNPDAAMVVTSVNGNGQAVTGQLVIVWTGVADSGAAAAEETGIVIRGTIFNYDAAFTVTPDALHTNYQMTVTQKDQVLPDVAINPSLIPGGANPNRLQFVVSWQAEGQQGSGSDVFARRFGSDGNPLDAGNVLVNTTTSMPQRNPAVGIDANGNYFITWQSQGVDTRSWGIMGQAFDSAGNRLRVVNNDDFLVNVNVQGPQTNPGVAVNPEGKVVAIWAGPFVPTHGEVEGVEGEGGHQPGLFARLFKFNASGQLEDTSPSPAAFHVNWPEFQLAEVGAGEDVPASATLLSDGTSVVVWQAFEETGDVSGYGVYGQRVAANGTLIGSKFLINSTTLGYQSNPSVAALSDGRFVATWKGEVRNSIPNGPSQYDIFGRIFGVDNDPATADTPVGGAEFQINNLDDPLTPTNQAAPNVASDGANGFVVVWQTDAKAAGELGTEIYARRFTSASGTDATPLADEFRVNEFSYVAVTDPITNVTSNTGEAQVAPRVAMNTAGQFAVVWVSDHNVGANPADTEKSVFVRWFGATVQDQATVDQFPAEFLANVYAKDAQEQPAIAMDAYGKMVVVWQSINQETGGQGVSWGVFARQFNPDGTSPQSQEFQVNQTVNQPQRFAAVGMDSVGRFAIAWQAINQDGSSWGIFQRQYNAAGIPVTGEEQVNTQTSGPQIQPVFARSPNGSYTLFWSGGMAEHVDGVGGRVYYLNEAPTGLALTNTTLLPNAGLNAVVGSFVTTDPDPGSTFTYALVPGVGDASNDLFNISGMSLLANASLDYSTVSSYTVRVKSTDQGGLSIEQTFTITNPGTVIHGSTPTTINLNAAPTDGDASSFTVTLVDPLLAIRLQYGFTTASEQPQYFNFAGQNEKYLLSGNNSNPAGSNFYMLKPDGKLYAYNPAVPAGNFVAKVGLSVYENPALLLANTGAPIVSVANPLHDLRMALGFNANSVQTQYFNFAGQNEKYLLSGNNSNPAGMNLYVLTATNTLLAYSGSQASGTLIADFTALNLGDVYANPALLTSATLGTTVGVSAFTTPTPDSTPGGTVTMTPLPGFDRSVNVRVDSAGVTPPTNRSFVYTVTDVVPTINAIADRTGDHVTPLNVPLTVNDSDPDSATRTFAVEFTNPLYDVKTQYGLDTPYGFYNYRGAQEKYVLSSNNSNPGAGSNYFAILPDNKLYKWNGGAQGAAFTGTFVLDLAPYGNVYANPALLTSAGKAPPVANVNRGPLYDLKVQYGLTPAPGSFNFHGAKEHYFLSVNGSNAGVGGGYYFITPDGKLSAWDGISTATSPVVATPGVDAYYSPSLITDASPSTVGDTLFALKTQYGFNTRDAFFNASQGGFEKYLDDGTGTYGYFLRPNGDLFARTGTLLNVGTLIANVGTDVYAKPALLYASTGQADAVSGTFTGNTLTLTPNAAFVGSVRVTVKVSDGAQSGSQSFLYTVTNTPPVQTQIPPVVETAFPAAGSRDIDLSAYVSDADPLTFSTTVTDPLVDLRSLFGLDSFAPQYTGFNGGASVMEKYVSSSNGSNPGASGWFFIKQDGTLWALGAGGGSAGYAASVKVGDVGTAVYADPSLLTNATVPASLAGIVPTRIGNVLRIAWPANYQGSFNVNVISSDGASESRQSFLFTVQ